MITKLNNCWNMIKASLKNEEGQGMVEYALIIGLVAVLLIGALNLLQVDIGNVFKGITDAM